MLLSLTDPWIWRGHGVMAGGDGWKRTELKILILYILFLNEK